MKKIILSSILFCLIIGVFGFVKYRNESPYLTIMPSNASGIGNIVTLELFNNWIGGVTPVENVFVKPADSPNFVGDNNFSPSNPDAFDREDFFRWSEQMFLWILSPTPEKGNYNGGGGCSGGLVLTSQEFYDCGVVDGVFGYVKHQCVSSNKINSGVIDVGTSMTFGVKHGSNGKKNLPIFFEIGSKKMYDVDRTPKSKNGYQLVNDINGKAIEVSDIKIKKNIPTFYDLNKKEIKNPSLIFSKGLDKSSTIQKFTARNNSVLNIANPSSTPIIILPEQTQAGGDNVLMARNGSLIYYNIMVNDIYVVFSQMISNGTLPTDTNFPTTLAELNVVKDYAHIHNIPIVDTENRALAMELKTSWVENINLPYEGVNYVKVRAVIPNYVQVDERTWKKEGTRSAELALVGMHVVGSMKGHPEMVWSTFEQLNNTPNPKFSFTNNSGGITTVAADTNADDWLFCKSGATVFNESHINNNLLTNTINGSNGFSISPSDTQRNMPFGWGGLGKGNPIDVRSFDDSNAQLIALNTDVNNRLVDKDVRKKYFQVGATWGSLIRLGTQVGTVKLSNSTMETYSQSSDPFLPLESDNLNCFSCHETGLVRFTTVGEINLVNPAPATLFLSHVFGANIIQSR